MIKVKNITKKAGFTKEQQQYIADVVLNEINLNKNIEAITKIIKNDIKGNLKNKEVINLFDDGKKEENTVIINVPETRCKFEVINDLKVLVEFLQRVGVSVTASSVTNRIYEQLRNSQGKVIECPDAYSNGHIAISKEFIGEVPTEETLKNIQTLKKLTPTNLIKLDGYTIAKNQKSNKMKGQYCIFYKNKKDDFIVFNQKYINMLPKGCEIYFQDNKERKYSILVAKKEEKIVALIMPITCDNLKQFELLPEIAEENIVKYPIVAYQKNKMPIRRVKEKEMSSPIVEHKNALTGHIYKGLNAEALTQALKDNNYIKPEWVATGQAKKLNKQIKKGAKGITIRVYYEDDSGRSFCKLETIYNVADLEEIQKIETTTDYKNMIERLKRA